MSKKKTRRKSKPKPANKGKAARNRVQEAAETRTAVAANVAWMLSLMSTIIAEVLGLVCRWYTVLVEPVDLLTVLSSVMLFVAMIAGAVTLALTPVVLRVAKSRPPRTIVQVAILAGVLPFLVVVLQSFLQG